MLWYSNGTDKKLKKVIEQPEVREGSPVDGVGSVRISDF